MKILSKRYSNYQSFVFSRNNLVAKLCVLSLRISFHGFFEDTKSNYQFVTLTKIDESHKKVQQIQELKYTV